MTVTQYFSVDGTLLAERDPWLLDALDDAAFTKNDMDRVRAILSLPRQI
jgi:hypothetical protein